MSWVSHLIVYSHLHILFLKWALKTAKASDPTKPGSVFEFIISSEHYYLGNNSILLLLLFSNEAML